MSNFKCMAAAALAFMCLMLSACSQIETPEKSPLSVPAETAGNMPKVSDKSMTDEYQTATLFFRYSDEPYLAAETRNISVKPNQSFEFSLMEELLSGPAMYSSSLQGVFPKGTHLVSVSISQRTMFVTLSGEILSGYSDEPENWQNDDSWLSEVPLRRQLCMQSIAATATENCSVDNVQIFVETAGENGRTVRLDQGYFMLDEENDFPAKPICREENMILSSVTTMERIAELWMSRDWQRLFKYVSLNGAENVASFFSNFVMTMENLPAITECECGNGFVNAENGAATFTIRPKVITADGTCEDMGIRIVHLCRENGIWKISFQEMTGVIGGDAE